MRMGLTSNRALVRRDLIARFAGKTTVVSLSREDFRLYFPTQDSIVEFIHTTGLHIHGSVPGWHHRVSISVSADAPWQ